MLLNTLAFVGAVVVVIAALAVLLFAIEFENNEEYAIFKMFGFGVIVARSKQLQENLNKLRKTSNKRVFITAPRALNKIWNIGGEK